VATRQDYLSTNAHTDLAKGSKIAKNTVQNLTTGIGIVLLNMMFVPWMLRAFGTELYGVLAATWMILAYFSWLDFGMSAASARFVARELAFGDRDAAASWAWTAIATQTVIGMGGALLISALTPVLLTRLHVDPHNQPLVAVSLHLFAFSIPLTLARGSLNGILQAGQRFAWINVWNIVSTVGTYVVYSCGILLKANFRFIIYGLFLLKCADVVAACVGAARVLPGFISIRHFRLLTREYASHVRAMARYGSWVTIASIIGPLLTTLDQWMISTIIGVALLPFYIIPFNLLMRLTMFPSSLSPTLFPAFTALHAKEEWSRIESYFIRAHRYLFMLLIPILFLIFTWGQEFLRLWIGGEFAQQAIVPLRILTVGFGIALLAPFSGTLLEGIGRPDVLTKLYLVEVPFNIASVYLLTKYFGIPGAALSFTIRAFVETVLIWIIVYKIIPLSLAKFVKDAFLRLALALVSVAAAAWYMRGARLSSPFDWSVTVAIIVLYVTSIPTVLLSRTELDSLIMVYRTQRARST
jgi:O-antigen/teichoic acid export membrane protein